MGWNTTKSYWCWLLAFPRKYTRPATQRARAHTRIIILGCVLDHCETSKCQYFIPRRVILYLRVTTRNRIWFRPAASLSLTTLELRPRNRITLRSQCTRCTCAEQRDWGGTTSPPQRSAALGDEQTRDEYQNHKVTTGQYDKIQYFPPSRVFYLAFYNIRINTKLCTVWVWFILN